METDILIVGGGSAGLSCALEVARLYEQKKAADPTLTMEMPTIMVLEKGSEIGAHSLSGAIMNPAALKELIPDFLAQGFPFESEVKEDEVHYLSKTFHFKLPLTPPPFKNHGNYIVSIKDEIKKVNLNPTSKRALSSNLKSLYLQKDLAALYFRHMQKK